MAQTAQNKQHDFIDDFLAMNDNNGTSQISEARLYRSVATENTQLAWQQLLAIPSKHLNEDTKYHLAAWVARQTGYAALAQYYQAQVIGEVDIDTADWQSAMAYVKAIVLKPKSAHQALVANMQNAGWANSEIVLLAQWITFVTYQVRLIAGLALLKGILPKDVEGVGSVVAGVWNEQGLTHLQQTAPVAFTTDTLDWEPWLPSRSAQSLTENEAAILKQYGQLHSDYFLLLAEQSQILHTRTLIDRGVFYTSEGLPRWERELAATVVSKVNACIYCASVHARKAGQYAKHRQDDISAFLAIEAGQALTNTGGHLAQAPDERWDAIVDFAAALSATPMQVNTSHVARLEALNMSILECVDLVQSTAFFAWANRLMLSLGEPFIPNPVSVGQTA